MVIPDSVTSIGTEAFYYCTSLSSVVIPDSVTSIGTEAFYYCTSLSSVVIPDSVTSIGFEAFRCCGNLTSVTMSEELLDSINKENTFAVTPWLRSFLGPIKGSYRSYIYELTPDGKLFISKGSGFYNLKYSLGDYCCIVKSIVISNVTGDVTFDFYEDSEKYLNVYQIVNNSDYQIGLYNPIYNFEEKTFSWCNINDMNEPIYELGKGTAVRVNEILPLHYKLVFDGNGATSGSMSTILGNADEDVSIPKNQFEKDGYKFLRWEYRDPEWNETKYLYDEGCLHIDCSDLIESNVHTITLVAQWEISEYNIIFDGNGATSGSMSTIIGNANEYVNIPKNQFKKDGYKFIKWAYKDTYDEIKYLNDENSLRISSYDLTKRNTITLVAQWEKDIPQYTITFDGNGSTSGTMAAITAKADKNTFINLNSFIKEGYRFICWKYYLGSNQNTIENGGSINLSSDIVRRSNIKELKLIAQWQLSSCTLSFDGNGATGGSMNDIALSTDKYIELPKNAFVKNGYSFVNWKYVIGNSTYYRGDEDGIYISSNSLQYLKDNKVTLVAQWEKLPTNDSPAENTSTNGASSENNSNNNSSSDSSTNASNSNGSTFTNSEAVNSASKMEVDSKLTDIYGSDMGYIVTCADQNDLTVEYIGNVQDKSKKELTISGTVTDANGNVYTVTSIKSGAFKGNKNLKKLTIPNTVTKIGSNAFKGCKNLKKIIIYANPNLKIGKNAFKKLPKDAVITVKGLKGKQKQKLVKEIKKQTNAKVK